jgi:uncharacterized protein
MNKPIKKFIMRNLIITLVAFTVFAFACTAQDDKPEFEKPVNVLVFSKTAGFRHESISSGPKNAVRPK